MAAPVRGATKHPPLRARPHARHCPSQVPGAAKRNKAAAVQPLPLAEGVTSRTSWIFDGAVTAATITRQVAACGCMMASDAAVLCVQRDGVPTCGIVLQTTQQLIIDDAPTLGLFALHVLYSPPPERFCSSVFRWDDEACEPAPERAFLSLRFRDAAALTALRCSLAALVHSLPVSQRLDAGCPQGRFNRAARTRLVRSDAVQRAREAFAERALSGAQYKNGGILAQLLPTMSELSALTVEQAERALRKPLAQRRNRRPSDETMCDAAVQQLVSTNDLPEALAAIDELLAKGVFGAGAERACVIRAIVSASRRRALAFM